MVNVNSLRSYLIMPHYLILHFIFEPDFNTGFLHETWICPFHTGTEIVMQGVSVCLAHHDRSHDYGNIKLAKINMFIH